MKTILRVVKSKYLSKQFLYSALSFLHNLKEQKLVFNLKIQLLRSSLFSLRIEADIFT